MPTGDLPPGIPRSPTGRVPAWVIAEATASAPVADTGWRSWEPPPPTPRHRHVRSWLVLAALVGVLGLVGWASVRPVDDAAVAGGPPGAAAGADTGQPATSYAFRSTEPATGAPVGFDPCTPVLHYVVRPDGAPPDGDAIVAGAFAEASLATGFTFVLDGRTTEGPRPIGVDPLGGSSDPLLVAWSDEEESPSLEGTVAGWASGAAVSTPSAGLRYRTGQVVLDAEQMGEYVEQPGGRTLVRGVVMHEIAHVLGLDHVDDPTQLMNPTTARGVTGYRDGDLAGLAAVGTGRCGS